MTRDELAIVPFITHKLPIVFEVSERVTVLRRGKVSARLATTAATERSLAREMVGQDVIFRMEQVEVEKGKPILQVENLSAFNDKDFLALKGASFSIHEGEIFGIAGISGNGQQELVEVLAGLRKVESGRVLLDSKDITNVSSLERWQLGRGYIPSDRNEVGSIADFSLVENTAMNHYFDDAFYQRGALDYRKLRDLTEEIISEYSGSARQSTRWEKLTVRFDRFASKQEARAALGNMGNEVLRGAPLHVVAQRQSQSIDASEGGYHDWTTRGSLASEAIDQAIFTLPAGRLSERLEDSEGFHIVRVIERTEAGRLPFEQPQVEIKETLRKERVKDQIMAYVDKLKQQIPVWTAFVDQTPAPGNGTRPAGRS